ncbi:25211_t:CDS:2 [Cetraspora pellucida]|uniref:25211_t:CDS:1 n=1 Tax=Cetraspora pellucida TaxID=1433469 RepID=A0A9N8WBL0_9GLOM|nr:25211_t:CDS:2 [Cetraspora pellucida]
MYKKLITTEIKKKEILQDLLTKEYEEITNLFNYYFDKKKKPVIIYNIETLSKDQKERIKSIQNKNPNLFVKSISELG